MDRLAHSTCYASLPGTAKNSHIQTYEMIDHNKSKDEAVSVP